MEQVVKTDLTPEDHYDILDVGLTEILQSAGIENVDADLMKRLIMFDRCLRIALGLPVEVPT